MPLCFKPDQWEMRCILPKFILGQAFLPANKDNPDEAAKHGTNEKALKYCRGVKDTGKLIEAQGKNTKNGMLIEFCFHDEEIDSKWMLRNIAEGEKPGGVNPLTKTVSDAIVEFVNRQ